MISMPWFICQEGGGAQGRPRAWEGRARLQAGLQPARGDGGCPLHLPGREKLPVVNETPGPGAGHP